MSQLPTPFDQRIELIGEAVEVLRLRRRLYRFCLRTGLSPVSALRIAEGKEPADGAGLSTFQALKIAGIQERIRVIERGPQA